MKAYNWKVYITNYVDFDIEDNLFWVAATNDKDVDITMRSMKEFKTEKGASKNFERYAERKGIKNYEIIISIEEKENE